MKKFEEARLEIIELNEPDVIATSDCCDIWDRCPEHEDCFFDLPF